MKKVILISILSLLFHSCSDFNFNKQKFTKLKTRSSKFVKVKETDKARNDVFYNEKLLTEVEEKNQGINDERSDFLTTTSDSEIKEDVLNNVKVDDLNFFQNNNDEKNLINSRVENKKLTQTVLRTINNKVNGLWFFLLLLGFPLIFIKKNGYTVAKWGSQNVKKAQFLIGVFSVLGLLSSFFLGNIFDFNITKAMFVVPVVLGVGSLVVEKVKTKQLFFKNKLAITMLTTSSLFLAFSAGNNASFQLFKFSNFMEIHPIVGIFLILIILAFVAVSIYIIVILACALSCAGATGLAAVVLLGGIGGMLLLAIFSIFQIIQGITKPDEKPKIKDYNKEKEKPTP